MAEDLRIDKWLWAARFFKSRGLAREALDHGRVLVAGQRAKPSRVVRVGDSIEIGSGEHARTVVVRGLSAMRGPAPVAQTLYEETVESIQARVQAQARKALAPEPAAAIEHGRPTKRDRRLIDRLRTPD